MDKLVDQFISEGREISYRCLSPFPGGNIIARFEQDHPAWAWRYEAEAEWKREPMSPAKARTRFPTDAVGF